MKSLRRSTFPVWVWLPALVAGLWLSSCGSNSRIYPNGLKKVRLGDPMIPYGTEKVMGVWVRDTTVQEGDYEWPVAILDYEDGDVFVEGDFHTGESIHRIRIESAKLKLKDGLHVGSTVAELQKKHPGWKIGAFPKYGLFEFFTPAMPNIHLLVKDPSISLDLDSEEYHISKFDPEAKVHTIVVF